MIRLHRSLVLLLIPALLFSAAHRRKAVATGPVTSIRDVSVIDVITGQITPHQDISMRGGLISDISRAASPGDTVRYAIPGLWDMHVHLWYAQPQFDLYLANGVTGVRDMGSDLKRVRGWQAAIAQGAIAGPRIYASGSPISTPSATQYPHLPVVMIETPDQARRAFDRYYDQRVDFIKVIDMPEPAFEALAEASRHEGIPFAGHLPDSVSAFAAAEDRMVSMEHLLGIDLACSTKENDLRNKLLLAKSQRNDQEIERIRQQIRATYDRGAAAALFDLFRRYDVRQTPTLSLFNRLAGRPTDEAGLRYIPSSIRKEWGQPGSASENAERNFQFAMKTTAEMAKAGVPILAGTDTGDDWTVPGATLHEELALLVKAGLTPVQALRSATYEPARLMRREDGLGQVRKGFAADIVVLEANPLQDIRNTRSINSVVVRGRVFDKAALHKMLADAAAAAPKT